MGMRIVLLIVLVLPLPTFALDLGRASYDCKLTSQCSVKGCSTVSYDARIRDTGNETYSFEMSDGAESFTQLVNRETLGDWNAYSYDDLPSFRGILVINKDGNASLTSIGSFFDELVSLQFFGNCTVAAE